MTADSLGTDPGAAYRRLLRAYPKSWRIENGEALLGVMLDVADAEGRDRPTAREGMAVVRHAARTWVDTSADRLRRSGAAASFSAIGTGALVIGTALSVVSFLFGEWFAGIDLLYGDDFGARGLGPFPSAGPALYALWLVAAAAYLAGADRAARGVLAVTAVAGPVLWQAGDAAGVARPPALLLLVLTVFAVAALAVAPAPDGSALRRTRVWTALAATGATALLTAVTVAGVQVPVTGLYQGFPPRVDIRDPGNADLFLGIGYYRYFGLGTLVIVAAPVVIGWLLVGIATVWTRPGRALAATLLGVPLLATNLEATSNLPLPGVLRYEGVTLVVCLGMLAGSLSLLVLLVRTLRAGPGVTGAAA